MEAGMLKNEECQDYLSELACISQIKLMITVDHLQTARLWNDSQLDKFNYYTVELNTFIYYDKEFEYQPPLFSAKNENQEIGIAFILKSMTVN